MPGFGNSRLSRAGMRMLGAFQDAISPGGAGGKAINDFLSQTAHQSRRMARPSMGVGAAMGGIGNNTVTKGMTSKTIVKNQPRGRGGLFGSTTTYDDPRFLRTDTKRGLFGMGGRSSSLQIRRPPMD